MQTCHARAKGPFSLLADPDPPPRAARSPLLPASSPHPERPIPAPAMRSCSSSSSCCPPFLPPAPQTVQQSSLLRRVQQQPAAPYSCFRCFQAGKALTGAPISPCRYSSSRSPTTSASSAELERRRQVRESQRYCHRSLQPAAQPEVAPSASMPFHQGRIFLCRWVLYRIGCPGSAAGLQVGCLGELHHAALSVVGSCAGPLPRPAAVLLALILSHVQLSPAHAQAEARRPPVAAGTKPLRSACASICLGPSARGTSQE